LWTAIAPAFFRPTSTTNFLPRVPGNALVNLRQTALHLGLGEVPVARVDSLEFASVDRNTGTLAK
jgi:hypothetical protein